MTMVTIIFFIITFVSLICLYNKQEDNNNVINKRINNLREEYKKRCSTIYNLIANENIAETIKIKYFTDDIDRIQSIDKGDWIDLRAADTVKLKQGESALIPLGVAMKLPEGYEAHVVPRSSTFKNFGIIQTNHFGIIDELYCGNTDQWMMPVYALRDTTIHKNDRICQFRITKHQPDIVFEEVKELSNTNRGGFGSTGRN